MTGCLALATARGFTCDVLVVDDASEDGTGDLVAAMGRAHPEVRVLRRGTRGGIAQTTHDGLRAAVADIVCYLDGDGQFDAADFGPMLDALDRADFIVGWRHARAERGMRLIGSRTYNAATAVIGVRIHDVNCGFRVCRRAVLDATLAGVESRSSFYFAELTWRVQRAGFRVGEVRIPHHLRRGGVPSGASLRVVAGQFADLARFAWRHAGRRAPSRP